MRLPVSIVLVACTLAACQLTTPVKGGHGTVGKGTLATTNKGTVVGDCAGATPPEPEPGATITVVVQTADGKPAAGVDVTVAPRPARGYEVLCAPPAVPGSGFSAKTDAAGTAGNAFQRYGTYLVTATKDGASATGELVVDRTHDPASLTLQLAPASPPPSALLQAPTEASTALAGVVTIEAAYTLAHGGSLLSDHGGDILNVGGGLLSDQGGNLVSNNAGNLIANNGGSIVSDHGGALVANNGGNLTGKTKRRLLAASAAGATLPAAGMLLRATSLRTHAPLSLGVDGQGQPVYAIYTNRTGAFKVYVPASEQGNVLLTAEVPATQDARQHYEVVAPAAPTQQLPIDEDSTVTAHYLRQALIGRMVDLMTRDPDWTICRLANTKSLSGPFKAVLGQAVTEIHDVAAAAGIHKADHQSPAVWTIATRCADSVLAQADMNAIKLDTSGITTWGDQPGEDDRPAVAAINEVFQALREGTAARLAASPDAFANAPYLVEANACDPGRYKILKAADLGAFIVEAYLDRNEKDTMVNTRDIIQDLGIDQAPDGTSRSRKLRAAVDSIGQALSQALLLNTNGERDRCYELIRAYKPDLAPAPGEPKPSVVPLPCKSSEPCSLPDQPATP